MVSRNSIPGGLAYIWQSKWLGIIAIKTESTQINFLSDVLVAVASLDLKVPIVKMTGPTMVRPVSSDFWKVPWEYQDYQENLAFVVVLVLESKGLCYNVYKDNRTNGFSI